MYEGYEFLLIERRGRVLVVTMNNPPLNPMTPRLHFELSTVFRDIQRDDEAAVVVLTGADRGFSAGGNIASLIANLDDQERWQRGITEVRETICSMLDLDKPIIGRINGHAMGLGSSLAVLCDITFAAENAKIADTHIKLGLVPGDGGALIWPMLIGLPRAMEYLLTGDTLTATRAAEIGLINYAVPLEELDKRVFELADRLAAGPLNALYATKRALALQRNRMVKDLLDAHLGLETLSHLHANHREAALAFRDKREPVFGGR
jgi:enoyl-CoA hydratase